jgi:hypothetical protein
MWTAWPILGGAIIGPVNSLDTLYELVTQQCGVGCTLEIVT